MGVFESADILLPRVEDMGKWAVVACDQFTSQPDYWQRVWETVGDAPSALDLILPEVELSGPYAQRIPQIHAAMARYLAEGLFREYPASFVYVERRLLDGQIRPGLVGAVDLEQYDYSADAASAVRATERTVVERIPPRQKVRRGASLELPHVLLLCDDPEDRILSPLAAAKERLPLLYDFELMEGGGPIKGWLVQGEEAQLVLQRLADYEAARQEGRGGAEGAMLYAVGDGNHSLATAKACWEELKQTLPPEQRATHPARFALVELENLYDESQQIEPIHRIVTGVDPAALLGAARAQICAEGGFPVPWVSDGDSGVLFLDPEKGQLPVGILQSFLDAYLAAQGGEIDYIHDDEALRGLAARPGTVGFLLPAIGKEQLFRGIIADGVLPRKTFSMGHAAEKRYYLEARRIL